jgi:hypothetical protein
MGENWNIYFVGTAGSGKTTLTYSFQLWMQHQGYDAITVNLDPGAERIPYPADVDVRDWISLPEVMDRYGLGPNGAQIMCADMICLKAPEIKDAIDEFKTDYVLIDTPGQMELFAYRESSRTAINILGKENSIIAFLFDPILSKDPLGFVSLMVLSASVQFRFPLPFVNILAKADMLEEETIASIIKWGKDIIELQDAILKRGDGMERESGLENIRALERLGTYSSLTPVSSDTNLGMADLYNAVQQAFMGGEDLTK